MAFYPIYRLIRHLGNAAAQGMDQRMGHFGNGEANRLGGAPKIWIHAASVGEVTVAGSMIDALRSIRPGCGIVLSTTTRHGHELALRNMAAGVTCIYAPLDFIPVVRRSLSVFKPDILTCIETEIWPNWLMEACRAGVKTVMVNGRISSRSIKGYLRFRSLFAAVFGRMDAFSMISKRDAERIRLMGAPEKKIEINGNAKYDQLIAGARQAQETGVREVFSLTGTETVLVAGSTHSPEEEMVLAAFERVSREFGDAILILAPRHVKRAPQVMQLAADRGLDCQLRTGLSAQARNRTAGVVVMDTIGELQAVYGVASMVFIGGSLTPLGGHNILEPAVWAKPVLYGPFMDDFQDAETLLANAGGGIQVKNSRDLADAILDLLHHPEKAADMGRRGREAVMTLGGAAERHAEVILRVLDSAA
jgi:3-deoxy-D-manno-octulosonic-acid transferase